MTQSISVDGNMYAKLFQKLGGCARTHNSIWLAGRCDKKFRHANPQVYAKHMDNIQARIGKFVSEISCAVEQPLPQRFRPHVANTAQGAFDAPAGQPIQAEDLDPFPVCGCADRGYRVIFIQIANYFFTGVGFCADTQ